MRHNLTIILLMFILLLPLTFASFTDQWGEYQDDPSNRGFVHDETGIWNSSVSYTQISTAYSFQPLIYDIDLDGSNELIISSGNFINVYSSSGVVENNIAISGTIAAQPIIFLQGGNEFIGIIHNDGANRNITSFFYNGTAYEQNATSEIPLHNNQAGLKCINNSNNCYVINSNQSICEINAVKNDGVTCDSTEINIQGITGEVVDAMPTIADIDLDSQQEFIFVCDVNADGNAGLCVYDVTSGNLDTGFSADGIIDDIDDDLENPIAYDVDGDGDLEVCTSYETDTSDRDVEVVCYHHTGATAFTNNFNVDTNARTTPPFIATINNNDLVCNVVGRTNGTGFASHRRVRCIFGNNNSLAYDFHGWGNGSNDINGITVSAADFNNDGHDDVITPRGIVDLFNNVSLNNMTTILNPNYKSFSIADIDSNGNVDIIAAGTANIRIYESGTSNVAPTINNSLSYGGYGNNLGYSTPVCVNSSVTYSAQETGGTLSGNYFNDFSEDTERIVTNCGQLANGLPSSSFTDDVDNGTFVLSNPQFSCFFNETGIFNVRLFLQDSVNPTDFNVFNTQTIVVNVITGTSGSTCNVINSVNPGETTPVSEITVGNEFDNFIDEITQGSSVAQQFGGLLGVAVFTIGAAFLSGGSVLIILIVYFLSTATFTWIIPMLSSAWFILSIVAGIVSWLIMKMLGGSNNPPQN